MVDVPVLWLEVTFERGSGDLWIRGRLVVTKSRDSWVVRGELHTSQVSGKGEEHTLLDGTWERNHHGFGRTTENKGGFILMMAPV